MTGKCTFSPLKLFISLVSFCVFVLCFFHARPIEPTHDAIIRFSMASNLTSDFWYLLLLNEPFALMIVLISRSAYEFLLVYAFIASIITCLLLRIPLWVWGFFILSPLGYLLTFNITPSLIAFSIVNFTLLTKFRPFLVIFGLTNHVVTFLSFSHLIRRFFWMSFGNKLLASVFLIGIFFSLLGFMQDKLLVYAGVQGNIYHIYFAVCCLLAIMISGIPGFRFVALIYMLLILAVFLVSVKMSSRIAFGVDLLTLQFCIVVVRAALAKMYPSQFMKHLDV